MHLPRGDSLLKFLQRPHRGSLLAGNVLALQEPRACSSVVRPWNPDGEGEWGDAGGLHVQFQKPLESLSGSCPASQRHAEGFSKPSAHFSLQTSAQRAPFQTELPRATSQSPTMFLLASEKLLPYSSLPSQSFLYGLQINMPQTQTSLHSFLPWLRNLSSLQCT